jgi:hypothetical protein
MKVKNMKCEKCNMIIKENEVYRFKGKILCDDCYIDLVMGVPEVDISQLSPELQRKFKNIKKGWNRNRPIYKQIKFK